MRIAAAVESAPRRPQPGPPRDSTAIRPTDLGPADAAVLEKALGAEEGLAVADGAVAIDGDVAELDSAGLIEGIGVLLPRV